MKTERLPYEGDSTLRNGPFDAELPALTRLADALAILRELVSGATVRASAVVQSVPVAAKQTADHVGPKAAISRVHPA